MPQKELTLENLKSLDFGIIEVGFRNELKRLIEDCNDRPNGEKRVVSVAFNLIPKLEGRLVTIAVEGEITGKIPNRRSSIYLMRPTDDGKLLFNAESPSDPDQVTLADEMAAREQEQRLKLSAKQA